MIQKGKIIENVKINAMGGEGKSIARIDDFVIFVEDAVPGDIVDVFIHRKKKNYAEGRAVAIHTASTDRVEPFCRHFGTCGGCKWQHLSYSKQLEFKQQIVYDALYRIGKLELPELMPITGSEKTRYYRNKLEYTFSNSSWLSRNDLATDAKKDEPALGFHVPLRFDKILDIKTCYLQDDLSNSIRLEVKKFSVENGYDFFDLKEQKGELRNLIIRNTTKNEWMVLVVFYETTEAKRFALLRHLKEKFPFITSLLYAINLKKNDTLFDQTIELFHGKEFITEEMEGINFSIGAKSFFQTNSTQAYELYKIVRNFAGLTGNENVYDLYTGTGTIAAFVSSKAKHVTGIDYIEESINDARKNAMNNNIQNVTFYAGDIKSVLNHDFINMNGKPDVIITDPPRAGMHEDVVKSIVQSSPGKIVYVSCNPSTQARDLLIMKDEYRVEKVQPVDMFPHTAHVENVVLLSKK